MFFTTAERTATNASLAFKLARMFIDRLHIDCNPDWKRDSAKGWGPLDWDAMSSTLMTEIDQFAVFDRVHIPSSAPCDRSVATTTGRPPQARCMLLLVLLCSWCTWSTAAAGSTVLSRAAVRGLSSSLSVKSRSVLRLRNSQELVDEADNVIGLNLTSFRAIELYTTILVLPVLPRWYQSDTRERLAHLHKPWKWFSTRSTTP